MDELTQKIRNGLIGYGFESKKKDKYPTKKTPSGRWVVGLAFIKHVDDFDVTMGVSGRIDALAKLQYGEEDSPDTCFTFGGELGNISGDGQKRWTVSSQEDIDSVVESMLEAFAQIGRPYLEKYSVLENALDAFSRDDRASWKVSLVHDARAKQAIATAFLLGKKKLFYELAEKKTAYLKAQNDSGLQSFLDFRRKLEERLNCGQAD
jgi:hypothetical protein